MKINQAGVTIERGTIGIDFDGVVHDYTKGWQGGEVYGEEVPGAFETIYELMYKGFEVFLFTSRGDDPRARQWLREKGFSYWESIEMTDKKKGAIAYIDDRAIRFTNWSDIRKYFI